MGIAPTIGRVLWYHPSTRDHDDMTVHSEPLAAIVTHVWSDTCVNLVVFDSNGRSHGRTSVWLEQNDGHSPSSPWCEWMPFQKGQAAKAEQLEAKLKETPA